MRKLITMISAEQVVPEQLAAETSNLEGITPDGISQFISDSPLVAVGIAVVAVVAVFLFLRLFWVHTLLGMVCAIASFFVLPPITVAVATFFLLGIEVLFTSDEYETGTYLIFGSLVEITETWNPVGGFLFRFFMGVILFPAIMGGLALIPYFNYVVSLSVFLLGIKNIKERYC